MDNAHEAPEGPRPRERKPGGWVDGLKNKGTKDRPRWYCRYVGADGRQHEKATKQPSKDLARDYLVQIQARVARGEVGLVQTGPKEKRQKHATLGDLLAEFCDKVDTPKIRKLHRYKIAARSVVKQHIKPDPIHARPASEVRPAEVRGFQRRLLDKGLAPGTVNTVLRYLGAAYSWGREAEFIPSIVSPTAAVQRLAVTPLDDCYSLTEIHRLFTFMATKDPPEFCGRSLYPLVWACAYTGARRGELMGLTWPHVHLDAVVPYIEIRYSYQDATKTGRTWACPIHPEWLPELRRWAAECPKTEAQSVFPVESLTRARRLKGWRRPNNHDLLGLPRLLGAADVHIPVNRTELEGRDPARKVFHAFRHSLTTIAGDQGLDVDIISRCLGHSTGKTSAPSTANYLHPSRGRIYAEFSRLTLQPPPEAGVSRLDDKRRRSLASVGPE